MEIKSRYNFIPFLIYIINSFQSDSLFSIHKFGLHLSHGLHAIKGLFTLFLFRLYKYNISNSDLIEIKHLAWKGLPITKAGLTRLIGRKPTIFKFDNVYFVVDNLHSYSWSSRLLAEQQSLKFINKYFKENHGIFVDVGACVGGYAIRIAKYAKRVYAIELELKNFYFLKLNKEINKINNLIIINAAAYYTKTKIPLYVSNISGYHSIFKRISENTLLVNTTTLDEILAKEEFIDIIKIDVEGAEHFVLEGAKETLKKTKYIIIEAGSSFKRTKEILENNNYELIKFFDGHINTLFVNKRFNNIRNKKISNLKAHESILYN